MPAILTHCVSILRREGDSMALWRNSRSIVLLAAVSICGFGLASCATQSGETVSSRYQVVQIARETRGPGSVESRRLSARINAQKRTEGYIPDVEFDELYRHPLKPMPLPVDCSSTDEIGVHFLLLTNARPRSRQVKVRYEWSHESIESSDARLNHVHTVYIPAREDRWIANETLELKDEFKVDGEFRLRATINGDEVFVNAFELAGCP